MEALILADGPFRDRSFRVLLRTKYGDIEFVVLDIPKKIYEVEENKEWMDVHTQGGGLNEGEDILFQDPLLIDPVKLSFFTSSHRWWSSSKYMLIESNRSLLSFLRRD